MTMESVASRTASGRSSPRAARKRDWTGWVFMGPFMLVFLFVLAAPVLYSLYLSVFETRMVGGTQFVGIDNYVRVFQDQRFVSSLVRVLVYFAIQVPVMLFLALVSALAIDSPRLRARPFFRIVIFLPYAVPAVVATLMWGFMFGDRFGLVAGINDLLGTSLSSPLSGDLILVSIAVIQTWSFAGYNMLIFYSALRTIPTELYEAAEMDGANGWWIIRAIKLPAIRGSITIALVFSIIGSFQLFNEPNILRTLVPNSISTFFTPNMYAYNLAFSGQQYNYSATVAIVMGLITVVIALGAQYLGNRKADG